MTDLSPSFLDEGSMQRFDKDMRYDLIYADKKSDRRYVNKKLQIKRVK